MNNKTYVIVLISELNNVNYSQVDQTSASTVRKSIDESMFILKFDGAAPTTITSLDGAGKLVEINGEKYLTHSQALALMATEEWFTSM